MFSRFTIAFHRRARLEIEYISYHLVPKQYYTEYGYKLSAPERADDILSLELYLYNTLNGSV